MKKGVSLNISIKDNTINIDCDGYLLISQGEEIYNDMCNAFELNPDCVKWVIHEHVADIVINFLSTYTSIDFCLYDNMHFFGVPVEIIK